MKYKLKEMVWHGENALFLVEFDNSYDLAMTFLRYQEYYESASSKFKGKQFTILDYMEWYSKKHNGCFTYPTDWAGFNIPDWVISNVMARIPDRNKYDQLMHEISREIKTRLLRRRANYVSGPGKFYLIGAVKEHDDVISHEVAHGLYYINSDYSKAMDALFKEIPKNQKDELLEHFKTMGYARSVWKDEAQAYLSTGDYDWDISEKFADVFNSHHNIKNGKK